MTKREDGLFVRRVLIGLGLLALALAAWQLRGVLLMVFGAILVALALSALSAQLERRLGLGRGAALLGSVLLVLVVLGGMIGIAGTQIAAEAGQLARSLPAAWQGFQERLAGSALEPLFARAQDAAPGAGGIVSNAAQLVQGVAGGLADLLVVMVGGVFLALQPRLYRHGLIELVPPARRSQAEELLRALGGALRGWITGQLTAMLVVGVVVTLGLWAIGVPSALALGLLAGLLEAVPFIGPVASAVPALLLATGQDTTSLILTLLLFIVVQQVEGNVLLPYLFRRTVDLPPALTIFAVIAFGTLFGFIGLLLAAPLTVVAYVTAAKLYVRDTLGDPVEVPGETATRSEPSVPTSG